MSMADPSEKERLAALRALQVLDTPSDPALDDLVAAVRAICGTPVALVSLVDDHRQWFKARDGLEICETPLDTSVCALAMRGDALFTIPDLSTDPRTAEMWVVTGPVGARFYAGAPLVTRAGARLGSLCAIDTQPRPEGLSATQAAALTALARTASSHLELLGGEAQRRGHDRRQDALVELGDRQRTLNDATALAAISAETIGRTLGASRAGYGLVDPERELVELNDMWLAPGMAALPRLLRFRDFGSYIDDLKLGRDVVINDVAEDPRTAPFADALAAVEVGALANLPVAENGRTVALVVAQSREPRVWRRDEIAFLREIADRTRLAMERARVETELRELNATLEDRVAMRSRDLIAAEEQLRQSQKMEAIGQLTGGVAHDFNNLLTVIRNSADLLRTRDLPEERRRRYVDAIASTADRAAKLTSQLLAFSRRQALKPEVFDARGRLAGVADMLLSLLGGRIALELEPDGPPAFVEADIGQFETAVVNLVVNARDAMRGEGRLAISVAFADTLPAVRGHAGAPGAFVAVSVADTGGGVPVEVMERIFEPFFTTKEVGKGTGLGLSQVFGFAKQSGGEVDVRNDDGRGAVFTLYLPRVDAPPPKSPAPAASAAAAPGKGRVLIVEDNLEVGEFATQLLADLGYTPTPATDASQALALIEARGRDSFDVVFTDVVMPGMGGVELARRLRDRWPDLPVLLTSGYSHVLAEDVRHGFELLRKPYSVEELSRGLRRAMSVARSRVGEPAG